MSTKIDWAKLVKQGRAKAVGIGWNEKELEALKSGMSADDVRAGFLSKEEKEKYFAKMKNKEIPLRRMVKSDLIKIAKEMKLDFDENLTTNGDLVVLIENEREKIAMEDDENKDKDDKDGDDDDEDGSKDAKTVD